MIAEFTTWLRRNAQHYLTADAQARVARRYDLPGPDKGGSLFWTKVFVPIYRVMPWGIRRPIMTAIPGSHRQDWPEQVPPEGPAI